MAKPEVDHAEPKADLAGKVGQDSEKGEQGKKRC